MTKRLRSELIKVEDAFEGIELCWKGGWTDGLPVVPPRRDLVEDFLDYVGLAPELTIGEFPERGITFTGEEVATSAVMAGCLPQYMPVVIAAVEAITDPEFHLNITASLMSPWPLLVVNGPITKELHMHSGLYVFGSGNRANMTIGRAISLLLWNYAQVRPGGIMRGTVGHPARISFCIAENEDTPWEPLHVLEGFDKSQSTVTALLTVSAGRPERIFFDDAEDLLGHLATVLPYHGFYRSSYLMVIPPDIATGLARQGWTKKAFAEGLKERCRRSVADLKRTGRWLYYASREDTSGISIDPGDENRFVYLFKDLSPEEEYEFRGLFCESMLRHRRDILSVVAGGDAGLWVSIVDPYHLTWNPVTKLIKH